MKNNNKWSQLSMQQRADLIKLYTSNGITNIKDIRSHYNSFGDGGDTSWEDVDEFVEKAEPWISGTSLALLGATAVQPALGVVTVPAMTVANGVGVLFDGYQAVRDFQNGNYRSGVWNSVEAITGAFGAKAASKLARTAGGRAIGKFKEQLVEDRFRASGDKIARLMRKGLTYEKAAERVLQNTVNYVDNSSKVKDVSNGIREAYNKRFDTGATILDTTFDTIDVGKGISSRFKEEHPIEIYKLGGKLNKFTIGGPIEKNHYNNFGDGGETNKYEKEAKSFLTNWYRNPTTQQMMGELDKTDYERFPVTAPSGATVTDPSLARRVKVNTALNTPSNYVEMPGDNLGGYVYNPTDTSKNEVQVNKDFMNDINSKFIFTHEYEHGIQHEMPFVLGTTQPVEHNLKPGVVEDPYLDSRKETRSRIMEAREFLNLDPSKRDYTPEEAAEFQTRLREGEGYIGTASDLDRLTPETLAGYLNYMAEASINEDSQIYDYEDVNYAKCGGKLNKFATGGPTEEILNSNTNEPLITREEYLNRQRQNVITQSIENSNNRIQPAVPYIGKYKDQNDWEFQINDRRQSLLNLIDEAIKFNWGKEHIDAYKSDLKDLEDEYNRGYKQVNVPGATCIYTATDNYGKKYRVAGNKSFRSSPEKYGFTEINLNDIKPGDIIQDFSVNGTPTHALTFMGYSDEGKAIFNYSSGDDTEKAIKKNKNYPFYSEYGDPLFLNNEDNSDLKTYAAAYRFIGTQEDNNIWNDTYNQLRKNYAQNITNELKNVPSPIKGKAIQLNKTKLLTK